MQISFSCGIAPEKKMVGDPDIPISLPLLPEANAPSLRARPICKNLSTVLILQGEKVILIKAFPNTCPIQQSCVDHPLCAMPRGSLYR